MLPIAILAGGLATRLGSLTKSTPKCMLKINGRPFIDWQVKLLRNAGYQEFVFCISHKSDQIQEYLQDGSKFGIRAKYSVDGDFQLGTGGAIIKALPLLGSEFAVIYGDSYLPMNYSEAEFSFLQLPHLGLMTIFKNNGKLDLSNVKLIGKGLINYQKDSTCAERNYIDYGLTYFRDEAFKAFSTDKPIDLGDICSYLSESHKLGGYEVFERFYEVGSFEGIEEFSRLLSEVKDDF
jgi:N-acetyl-alpha-D-muramate 1-phosphate uridylyltransferase